MSLIKSISGIRGTIGGKIGENLTPIDTVKFASAYGTWLKCKLNKEKIKVVLGRDARISGPIISDLVSSTLQGVGIDVIDLGLSTTPTVEIMVPYLHADGGIIITASHNPKQWNALKLLNAKGEFISDKDGKELLNIADTENFDFVEVDGLGSYIKENHAIEVHIDKILDLPLVDVDLIKKAGFKIVVDAVNSTGGISVVPLLKKLDVEVIEMYCTPNGQFPHNPEPLEVNLGEIMKRVPREKADLGIVVDPDVDRLAFICEDGTMFGEEYTLVAISDYVLSVTPSTTVSNLSSSRALRDISEKYNQEYQASAVGEVNVVSKMKDTNALIGGEGNGGVIYPELHYGRDSLVGIALFLSYLAKRKTSVKQLRNTYPSYFMGKKKIDLSPEINTDLILQKLTDKYKNEDIKTYDGLKIDFPDNWVHLRKSNTEPIIRIYTEAHTQQEADQLADRFIEEIKQISR
ncbi:phosphomannomutase [Apibacter mensalis]|uniref:Phosphomannomutase n=1 Tax=Apibacter mensalis TaxID=1586267 RepID=A0A0X3AQU8_9FLAO|nr:phosphoglucosamine mutase [Apibacter mensalis]CVK16487.1 phosphomannomutase [Apibacter mensalis]